MVYLEILTSLILFFVMAYMSAIGTAYLTIKEKDLQLDEIKDKKKLKRLKEILNNSSVFVSSIRSGVSFCSLWLGTLIVEIIANPIYKKFNITNQGTVYIVKYFVILLTVILLTYLLYIFAELIPKSIAIKKKNKIVIHTIDFVYVVSKIFSPVSKFMKFTEEIIMRIFDVERKERISYKDSEIKESVEVAKELGTLSKKDSKVISNFLKLDETVVKDIMVDIENAVVIDLNSSKEKIKDIVLNSGYTRIPVCDGDIRKIVGIINVKTVLKNILEDKHQKIDKDKVIKPCMYVSAGKRLDLLFNEMRNNKEHMAIVVKEKDMAIGIVTMEDIFEEIVGNIEDDFEKYK